MATHKYSEEAEKRRSSRYTANWPVVFGGGKGKLRDISTTGIYFETRRGLKVSEQARVVVAVGAGKPKAKSVVDNCLRVEGRVVRSHVLEDGRYGVAVEFEQIRFCGPTPLQDLGRHLMGA